MVLAQIKAARLKHGLTLEAVEEVNGENPERVAERKLGLPAHGVKSGSPTFTLALEVIGTRSEDVYFDDWQRIRALCTLAVLDGYTLAAAALGPARIRRTFKGDAAMTRFAKSAAKSGDGLLAGPHAELVGKLIKSASTKVRPAVRPVVADLIAKALASGALLYATERDLTFPLLEVKRATRLEPSKAPVGHAAPSPELMSAILKAPFDDQPRLVYADYLSEQNDPQGLFISLQCGPQSEANDERIKALINKHQKLWLAPIRKLIRQWQFKRGFVNSVIADFSKFIDGQSEFSKVPLLHAKLTGYRVEQLAKANAAPHPTVASVDLGNNRLGAKNLAVLSKPFFSRITSLDVAGNSFDTRAVETLVASLPSGVKRLQLSSTTFSSDSLEILSRSKHFAQLTHLDLRWNRTLDARAAKLLEGAQNLEYLGLSIHQFNASNIEALASLSMPKLTRIAFDGSDVGGLLAFLKPRAMPALQMLDLPHDVSRKLADTLEAKFKPAPWPLHFEY